MGNYLVDYENVKKDGLNGIDKLNKGDRVYIFYSENADTLTFELHKKINESDARIDFQRVEVGTKNALDFQLSTLLGYLVASSRQEEYFIVTNDNGFHSVCNYWEKNKVKVSIVPDVAAGRVLQEKAAAQERAESRKEYAGEEPRRTETDFLVNKVVDLLIEDADRRIPEDRLLYEEERAGEKDALPEKMLQKAEVREPLKKNKKQKKAGEGKENPEKLSLAEKGASDKNKKLEKEDLYQEVSRVIADAEIAKMVAEYIQKCKTKQELNNTLIKKYPSKNNKRASELYQAVKPLLKNKKGN